MNSSQSASPKFPEVFIGSSGESKRLAATFQHELKLLEDCNVKRWDQNVFDPSSLTLAALIEAAESADFAVFIASGDDVTLSRNTQLPSVRDNVLFEFALFIGIVGLKRTYLMTEQGKPLKLPSDLHGLTQVPYKKLSDAVSLSDACSDAAYKISNMVRKLGPRRSTDEKDDAKWAEVRPKPIGEQRLIHSGGNYIMISEALDRICKAAAAQGWTLKARTGDRLRLINPRSRVRHTLVLSPGVSAWDLHRYVSTLRADGLRLSHFFPARPLS